MREVRGAASVGAGFGDGAGGASRRARRAARRPRAGTSSRPSTSTGVDGPASADLLTVLVEHGADAAPGATGDDRVADAQRAPIDEHGDDGPAALVEVRLEHERTRRDLRVRRELSTSATSRIDSSSSSTPRPAGGATSMTIVSPPHASGTSSRSTSCWRTRVGSASSRSTLVIATMIGTSAARGVADRFDRLRHHAVVGRDHEDRDVGRVARRGPAWR